MRLKLFTVLSIVVIFILQATAFAKITNGPRRGGSTKLIGSLSKSADNHLNPAKTLLSINNITSWIRRDGFFPWDYPGGWNGSHPKGTVGVVFAEGIVWGAQVSGDGDPINPRVNGSTYANGLSSGKVRGWSIDPDGSNYVPPTGIDVHNDQQIWRVRTDYATADLTSDAASFIQIPIGDVTAGDVQQIFETYEFAWNNWPAADGAPYEDVNGNGTYDPAEDIPGFPGASQTVWLVANDLDSDISAISYGSPSIGLEMQMTLWGYDFASTSPLGNITYKKVRFIYTGKIGGSADAHIDEMYLTQWSDPDLGTFTDDYVGTDVEKSLGYVYNGTAQDATYFGDFGLPVPAAGYDFLQGPIVAGDTLGMSSFVFFGAGSSISDPDLGVYEGTLQWFNLMQGFLPRPAWPDTVRLLDPLTGEATKFWLSGDPVTGTGWIDGIILPPGDRRLVMTTGPFEMALGDTQELFMALMGGTGLDNISSITVMKFHDDFAQFAYDNDFDLPSPPIAPIATAAGFALETNTNQGRVTLTWNIDEADRAASEDIVSKGFAFEGYNVYQLPNATSTLSDGIKVATYDLINLVQTIFDPGVDTKSGFIVQQAKQSGSNSGIQRHFTTTNDAVRGRPLSTGIEYFFAVTAYSFLADNIGRPFKTLESSPVILSVKPQQPVPGTTLTAAYADEVDDVHIGTADAFLTVNVIDQSQLVTADYEIFLDKQLFFLDVDGEWKFANADSTIPKSIGKVTDISASTVSGAAVVSGNVGTFDLVFSFSFVPSADDEWADGFKLFLPAGVEILSANITGSYGSFADQGQNCPNYPNGLVDNAANTILWGNTARSEFGCIEADVVFVVNVNPVAFPITVGWEAYDDGFGSATVDASGSVTLTELGYDFKIENHWNLLNVTTNEVLLEDQLNLTTNEDRLVVNGMTVKLLGSFEAPITFFDLDFTVDADPDDGDLDIWGDAQLFGAPTGFWFEFGSGTPVPTINQAQPDLEFRFTGVAPDNDSPVTAGGSFSTQWERGAFGEPDLSGFNRVQLRIPFELWDVDGSDSSLHHQIEVAVINRNADDLSPYVNDVGTAATARYRMSGRDYMVILNKPYTDDAAAERSLTDATATWLLFFDQEGASVWSTGDVYTVRYANPLQLGIDSFTFSTAAPAVATATDADISKINIYPNPYLGLHENETSRFDKFVTFNHLPEKATIRFFSLGGEMVKVIIKEDASQFLRWDLTNEGGFPVASGIYIIHIDMGDLGTKILKIALVQEEQILRTY